MPDVRIIPQAEFERIRSSNLDKAQMLGLIADMCRLNTLASVKVAGSGHLGSSLSAMDIVVCLYYDELNTTEAGIDNPARDIYFSSKGHDVPGLYAVLHSLGIIPQSKLLSLRRLGGLNGHPDLRDPGIEVNSGSLGMGISKGRGIAWGKAFTGNGGRTFVMTGDGELQEGQIYEALQGAAALCQGGLTVIVDANKVQSDRLVSQIVDTGDLQRKFETFGWHTSRCDGNEMGALLAELDALRAVEDKPKILIADTIKGSGVSFMEHPFSMKSPDDLYPWHSGAPDDDAYARARQELADRIDTHIATFSSDSLRFEEATQPAASTTGKDESLIGEQLSQAAIAQQKKMSDEFVANAYGEALLEQARASDHFVVLDADLSADCRLRGFEHEFPERFIECGIAEQDMVSMAGGIASQGVVPIVNSFASFLASRANEQIYNNATENNRIIYACHFCGLIPAGPGKSHQSIRDISLFGALPNVTILQPCNAEETKQVIDFALNDCAESCMIRLIIGPSPRAIALPETYRLTPGRGVALTEGKDASLFAYGPVMMNEALVAANLLASRGIGLQVLNMPWLNRVDTDWLAGACTGHKGVFVLEDHGPVGGLADTLLYQMARLGLPEVSAFHKLAVEGYPECGTPTEVLRHHQLDGASIAKRIEETIN